MHSEALFLWNSDGISKYQYALHTNNRRCKRAVSLRIGSLSELRPPFWLSSITLRYDILGRNPLVEGSARPRDLYLTKKTFPRHTSMPRRDSNIQTQETLALDRVAPGVDRSHWLYILHNCWIRRNFLIELILYYPWADYPFAYYSARSLVGSD